VTYFPPTDRVSFFHVGMQVRTPDTESGVISDIRHRPTRYYVSWGDNNRKVYSFTDSQQFVVLGTRYFQTYTRWGKWEWTPEQLQRGRGFDAALDAYEFNNGHLSMYARIAEVRADCRGDRVRPGHPLAPRVRDQGKDADRMSDDRNFVGLGPCYTCGTTFDYDLERVPSVLVDPHTDLPPDVHADGTALTAAERDTDAFRSASARAERKPMCPSCVAKLNKRRAVLGLAPLRSL
jgi:hypothetical protein